jgi:hypothetical protein
MGGTVVDFYDAFDEAGLAVEDPTLHLLGLGRRPS